MNISFHVDYVKLWPSIRHCSRNQGSSEQAMFFSLPLSKVGELYHQFPVFSWQQQLWALAAVAHPLRGLTCCAFRNTLLHTLVVTSCYSSPCFLPVSCGLVLTRHFDSKTGYFWLFQPFHVRWAVSGTLWAARLPPTTTILCELLQAVLTVSTYLNALSCSLQHLTCWENINQCGSEDVMYLNWGEVAVAVEREAEHVCGVLVPAGVHRTVDDISHLRENLLHQRPGCTHTDPLTELRRHADHDALAVSRNVPALLLSPPALQLGL